MKRVALVVVTLVGCGDDGGTQQQDAIINPGPDYDLSCLNNMPASVPATIGMMGTLYDFTTAMPMPIPSAMISARSATDNAEVGMGTTDMDGKFMFDVTGSGTPTRIYMNATATGFLPAHGISNTPLYASTGDRFLAAVKQSRVDDLATALGTTYNSAMGALEVWVSDCGKGEFPQATIQLDGATASWAMFGGVGVWIPREITLPHLQTASVGSMAGLINVAPGSHTVTVISPSGTLMLSGTINVLAGTWNLLVIVPGAPL